jgi:hypothetical protein
MRARRHQRLRPAPAPTPWCIELRRPDRPHPSQPELCPSPSSVPAGRGRCGDRTQRRLGRSSAGVCGGRHWTCHAAGEDENPWLEVFRSFDLGKKQLGEDDPYKWGPLVSVMAQKRKLARTFWAPLKSESSEKEARFEDLVEVERFRTRP